MRVYKLIVGLVWRAVLLRSDKLVARISALYSVPQGSTACFATLAFYCVTWLRVIKRSYSACVAHCESHYRSHYAPQRPRAQSVLHVSGDPVRYAFDEQERLAKAILGLQGQIISTLRFRLAVTPASLSQTYAHVAAFRISPVLLFKPTNLLRTGSFGLASLTVIYAPCRR